MTTTAVRYHDISCGHRVYGHESKCGHLHGHNYRVTFHCSGDLDAIGRVIDFSVIKSRLCMWLEDEWDHRTLLWSQDPYINPVAGVLRNDPSVVSVPFNPTAENIGAHLLNVVGPEQLAGTGVTLVAVDVEETRKCSASVSL